MRPLRNSPAAIRDNRRGTIPVVLCVFILASCTQSKTLTAEDIKRELASAVSLASETQMFVEQWQEDRLTASFIKAHLGYLTDEAWSSIKEIGDSQVEPAIASKAEICRTQLKALRRELLILRTDADSDVRPLQIDFERIERIRKSLQNAKSTS